MSNGQMTVGEIKNKLMEMLGCCSIARAQIKLRGIAQLMDKMEFTNFMNLVDSYFEPLHLHQGRDRIIHAKAQTGDLEGIAKWIVERINN